MATYPIEIDSDASLPRVDDNITEIGGEAINALRDAVFSIEKELGLGLSSPGGTLADRLDVSLNGNGTIKASALIAAGLVALPITNNQISPAAGIEETKLKLNHSTTDLYTLINGALFQINNLNSLFTIINSDLNSHITGAQILQNGKPARHVGSHIDLNAIPFDARDPFFVWQGLKDKNGNLRTATNVSGALLQINNELISHENSIFEAHAAKAVSVNTSSFTQIPLTANNVQLALEAIDQNEALVIEPHRATQHSNGIPLAARSDFFNQDGYYVTVVPSTKVETYLSTPPLQTTPQDNVLKGDDVIAFKPENPTSGYIFDSQFSQVKVGDIITVNYGNGIETRHAVESIRNIIGTSWSVRINGTNLFSAQDGYILDGYTPLDGYVYAKIERPRFDTDIYGTLAIAHANPNLATTSTWISSLITVDPKAASAVGIGFDPNQLDSSHYNLYLQFFPDGNPANKIINLSSTTLGIDVTGNKGTTPGRYTIDSVVAAANAGFRSAGFNYRFVAFNYKGNFGIAASDSINGCAFSIVNGTGPGLYNVIDDANSIDPLGLGSSKANVASPVYSTSYVDKFAAQLPTKIISPKKNRNYIVDGVSLDKFAKAPMTNAEGFWPAKITNVNNVGTSVEVTYCIQLSLRNSGIKLGKTITVQPTIPFSNSNYNDVDYGRFIIKEVNFTTACGAVEEETIITVINGVHANGNPITFTSPAGLDVNIYYGYDTVSFDQQNIIDQTPSADNYHRLHEIYVDRTGKTFSHEVLRMKVQSETTGANSGLLETTDYSTAIAKSYLPSGWSIVDVSPKLRGYFDDSSNKNKYLRFYVLNYDTVSGEFDGYIGKRDPANENIYKTGPITKSRKNIVARYYDESNIDYIDMQFIETSVGSPKSILSTPVKRYVDIEVFPSLELNKEYFLLAKCETLSGSNITGAGGTFIKWLRQHREFGTLSEKDFTSSAINFIESGDKYLHGNGVIKGFEFISFNSSGFLFFNGGLALVDGHISTVNETSIQIPQIAPSASLPQTVDWAICVNKNNELEPIIITPTKQQFSVLNKSPNYYVNSVTFPELVSTRKDLTPILLISATINSVTLSNPVDVRRFISGKSIDFEFVMSEQDGYGSNFSSFNSMIGWINKFGDVSNKVKLRGNFNITSILDLSSLTKQIILEGDGESTFNVSIPKGIIFGSNITLKNINFKYNPSGTYTGRINSTSGCLYANKSNSSLKNVLIEKCKFTSSTISGFRPPFISIETSGGLIQNVKVNDGYFADNNTTLTTGPGLCAAVSIVNTSSTISSTIADLNISGNICSQNQIINIGHSNVASNIIINSFINNNTCGAIGYLCTSNLSNISSELSARNNNINLHISNNTCHIITHLNINGGAYVSQTNSLFAVNYTLGCVTINDNYANHIVVHNNAADDNFQKSSLIICNNILTAFDAQYSSGYIRANFSQFKENTAICVYNMKQSSGNLGSSCKIINNKIAGSPIPGLSFTFASYYTRGITIASTGAIVSGNEISGVLTEVNPYPENLYAPTGIGIFIFEVNDFSSENSFISITNNQIFRNGFNLSGGYVNLSNASYGLIKINGEIINNYFDNYFINEDDSEETIKNSFYGIDSINYNGNWIIERNKNQTSRIVVHPSGAGRIVTGDSEYAGVNRASDNIDVRFNPAATSAFDYPALVTLSDNVQRQVIWYCNLSTIIPENTYLVNATISVLQDNSLRPDADKSEASLKVTGTGIGTLKSNVIDLQTLPINTLELAILNTNSTRFSYHKSIIIEFHMFLNATNASTYNRKIAFSELHIKYRW